MVNMLTIEILYINRPFCGILARETNWNNPYWKATMPAWTWSGLLSTQKAM